MIFQKIQTDNYDLQKVQENTNFAFKQIEVNPIFNGVFLKNVSLTGGSADTVINHGLRRIPAGFLIVAKDATGDVFSSSTTNPRPDLQIIVKSTAALTVTIWVF